MLWSLLMTIILFAETLKANINIHFLF